MMARWILWAERQSKVASPVLFCINERCTNNMRLLASAALIAYSIFVISQTNAATYKLESSRGELNSYQFGFAQYHIPWTIQEKYWTYDDLKKFNIGSIDIEWHDVMQPISVEFSAGRCVIPDGEELYKTSMGIYYNGGFHDLTTRLEPDGQTVVSDDKRSFPQGSTTVTGLRIRSFAPNRIVCDSDEDTVTVHVRAQLGVQRWPSGGPYPDQYTDAVNITGIYRIESGVTANFVTPIIELTCSLNEDCVAATALEVQATNVTDYTITWPKIDGVLYDEGGTWVPEKTNRIETAPKNNMYHQKILLRSDEPGAKHYSVPVAVSYN